jgi:hypothetical protein
VGALAARRFTKHRLQVMGADGVDLKPELDRRKRERG